MHQVGNNCIARTQQHRDGLPTTELFQGDAKLAQDQHVTGVGIRETG